MNWWYIKLCITKYFKKTTWFLALWLVLPYVTEGVSATAEAPLGRWCDGSQVTGKDRQTGETEVEGTCTEGGLSVCLRRLTLHCTAVENKQIKTRCDVCVFSVNWVQAYKVHAHNLNKWDEVV